MVHYYCTDEYRENHPLFYTLFEDSVVRELKTHDRNIITKSTLIKNFHLKEKTEILREKWKAKRFLLLALRAKHHDLFR
jgi:hypothetical protein